MFHKITFCISEKKLKTKKILDFFENIVFEKKNKYWRVQIITSNYSRDLKFLNLIFRIKEHQCVKISKKNWVLSTFQKDRPVKTNFFTISQNQLKIIVFQFSKYQRDLKIIDLSANI